MSQQNCLWCGRLFRRNRGARDAKRYCSRTCAAACRSAVYALEKAASRPSVDALARATLVRSEVAALRRIARYVERPRTFQHTCRRCGAAMTIRRTAGVHRLVCDACRREQRALGNAAYRAKRRAVERGAGAETIRPFEVFAAHGWRCAWCALPAPRNLRGTCHPQAPELDHVVPLAKGGQHVRANVQLLCRACNALKGDDRV